MQKYVVVRNGGSIVGKEIFSGDWEMEIEIRKALFPENTYQTVAEAAFTNAADPTSNYLLGNKYEGAKARGGRDIARAKRDEILAARRQNP